MRGSGQRYRGVRQRHWGAWVSEIWHPLSKTRVWLGTFQTADDAAHAYDEAARFLSGAHAKTNFPYTPSASPSTVLSSALREKLRRCCMDSVNKLRISSVSMKQKAKRSGFPSSSDAIFASWHDHLDEIAESTRHIRDACAGEKLSSSQTSEDQNLTSDDDIVTGMIEELWQSSYCDLDFLPELPSCSESMFLQCIQDPQLPATFPDQTG